LGFSLSGYFPISRGQMRYTAALAFFLPLVCFGVGAAGAGFAAEKDPLGANQFGYVFHIFTNGTAKEEAAFQKVYQHFLETFDFKTYARSLAMLESGLQNYKQSDVYTAYTTIPGQPHCDTGALGPKLLRANAVKGVSAFPGGSLKKLFGFDFSKMMFDLTQKAQGPSAAGGSQVRSCTYARVPRIQVVFLHAGCANSDFLVTHLRCWGSPCKGCSWGKAWFRRWWAPFLTSCLPSSRHRYVEL
jgi:hypothetical protein